MDSARREHAVVLGSGMAGLATARVLSDHFDRVTVVERDVDPDGPQPRKGVAQGGHLHVLLTAGLDALDELFPGLLQELMDAGAAESDFGRDVAWFHHGAWRKRYDSHFPVYQMSRPFIEHAVRGRVGLLEGVTIRYESAAEGLLIRDGALVGVRVDATTLPADLVVDCTGRSSQLPRWLKEAGGTTPEEERLEIDLCYSTREYRQPADPGFRGLLVYQDPPELARGGVAMPVEGERLIVTLMGYTGDHPPKDPQAFVEYARSLGQPHLYHLIRDAEPLTDPQLHRFPYARWRHYEQLADLPRGVVAVGDSYCCFDPVYGQGMTIGVLSAQVLGRALAAGALKPRAVYKTLSRLCRVPWMLAAVEDFRYPTVRGERPLGLGMMQGVSKLLFQACAQDTATMDRFIRVMHMVSGPEALMHPRVIWQLSRAALGVGGPTQDVAVPNQ